MPVFEHTTQCLLRWRVTHVQTVEPHPFGETWRTYLAQRHMARLLSSYSYVLWARSSPRTSLIPSAANIRGPSVAPCPQACSQADLDEHFFARGVSLPAYAKSLDARGATVVAPIGVEVGTALVRLLVVCPCIAPKEREATLGLPPHLPGAI